MVCLRGENTYCLSRLQIFKGCLPQNLLSPLLNTLAQLLNNHIKMKFFGKN